MWVDSGAGVPIGAEVTVTDTGQLQLVDDEGKVKTKNISTNMNLPQSGKRNICVT